MKGKKLLAGALSAAMVLGTMVMPAFAEITQLPQADENDIITITENADIDLNGATIDKKIVISGDVDYVNISNGTITNGEVKKVINGLSQTMYDYVLIIDSTADVALDNVKILGKAVTDKDGIGGIGIKNSGDVVITDSTVTSADVEVTKDGANGLTEPSNAINIAGTVSSVTIKDSTITGGSSICNEVITGYTGNGLLYKDLDGISALMLYAKTTLTVDNTTLTGGNSDYHNGGLAFTIGQQGKGSDITITKTTMNGGNGGVKNNVSNHGHGGLAMKITGFDDTTTKLTIKDNCVLNAGKSSLYFGEKQGTAVEMTSNPESFSISDSKIIANNGTGIVAYATSDNYDITLNNVEFCTENGKAISAANTACNAEVSGKLTITGDMGTNVTYNGDYTLSLRDTEDDTYYTPASSINGVFYDSFADALEAANDGDTINMCGSTVVFKNEFAAADGTSHLEISKNVTIKNGTIDISGTNCRTGNGIIEVADNKNVTFDGVTIKGEGYYSNFGVIFAGTGTTITMKSCKMDIKGEQCSAGAALKSSGRGKYVIIGGEYTWADTIRGITAAEVDIDGAKITATNTTASSKSFFRNVFGTIKNSTISADKFDNGIENTIGADDPIQAEGKLTVSNGTKITLTNMTSNDVMLVDTNCTSTKLVIEDTASVTMNKGSFEAKLGDTYYATLKEALEAANDGDTITLLKDARNVKTAQFTLGQRELTFDLNGHTIFFDTAGQASVLVYKNLKFISTGDAKGTIDFTNASVVQSIFWIYSENTTVTLDNVNLVGSPTKDSGAGFFQSNYLEGAKVVFNNSAVTLTGAVTSEEGVEPKVYNRESFFVNAVDAEFNNTTVSITGFDGVFIHGDFTLNNGSDITVENGNHALNYARLTMNGNAKFEVNGYHEDAIKLGEGSYIKLNDTSSLTINDAAVDAEDGVKDINYSKWLDENYDKSLITIDVAKDAVLEADLSAVIDGATVTGKANTISVKFDKVTDKEWKIVLTAPTELLIHEFTAAQLKFTKDAPAITYEIEGANDKIAVSEQEDGVYLFNLKNGAEIVGDENEVVIGKVVFVDGYSDTSVNFRVDENYTDNKVTATKGQNITEVFTVSDGKLTINANKIDISLPEPTCEVTINVAMNQEVKDNPSAFQKMTVVISGQNLDEPITYNLGNGSDEIAQANGVYKITTGRELKQNSKYMITVSGDGYRTGKYLLSIRDNDKATVNFWNNVQRTEKLEMEAGNADSKAWANFIAGDIVKDNKLDIFDLSAVVAYFGESTTDTDNAWAMVKYDLNRDGIIDAEDVAYVMNAWSGLEKVNAN